MAARATWKGFLKISLVNIPIKVFPATESSGSLTFNVWSGLPTTVGNSFVIARREM